jgi:hypothetical protein
MGFTDTLPGGADRRVNAKSLLKNLHIFILQTKVVVGRPLTLANIAGGRRCIARRNQLPGMCFFRGKNGSALPWFFTPTGVFLMADWLITPDFYPGICKKRRKNRRDFYPPPDPPKASRGAGCALP